MGLLRKFGLKPSKKSAEDPMQVDDYILVEFGRAREGVYFKIPYLPSSAKLLINLSKLAPDYRCVSLPDVEQSMYKLYLSWDESVDMTALKYKWNQIILLAHTSKILRDEPGHQKALDSMIAKAEQSKFYNDLMFTKDDWHLLHRNIKASEARDEPMRKVIIKLFQRSADLCVFLSISPQELRDMGITWEETCADETGDAPHVEKVASCDDKEMYNLDDEAFISPDDELAITLESEPEATSEAEDIGSSEAVFVSVQDQAQIDDWEVVSISSLRSSEESVTSENYNVVDGDPLIIEPAAASDDLVLSPLTLAQEQTVTSDRHTSDDGSEDFPDVKLEDSNYARLSDEDLVDSGTKPIDEIVQAMEGLTNHLKGLIVQDGAVSVDYEEEHDILREEESDGEEGGVGIQQNPAAEQEGTSPIIASGNAPTVEGIDLLQAHTGTKANSADSTENEMKAGADSSKIASANAEYVSAFAPKKEIPRLPSRLQLPIPITQAIPAARAEEKDPRYVAGFVPTKNLPRTAPGSPTKIEATSKTAYGGSKDEDEPPVPIVQMPTPLVKLPYHKQKVYNVAYGVDLSTLDAGTHPGSKDGDEETHERKHKYPKSVLNRLRTKQAASTRGTSTTTSTDPQVLSTNERAQEQPVRQPKGLPTSDKEMAKEKLTEKVPRNFAVGAPPRAKNRPKKRMMFSYDKDAHFAD